MGQFVQYGTQQLNSRMLVVSSFALFSIRFVAIKSFMSSFPTRSLFMFSLVRSPIREGLLQGEPIPWKAARLERGRRSNWPALLGVHGWGNYLPWRHCLPWGAECIHVLLRDSKNMTSDNLAAKRKLEWPFGFDNLPSTYAETCWTLLKPAETINHMCSGCHGVALV